jgi:hypothetical protein
MLHWTPLLFFFVTVFLVVDFFVVVFFAAIGETKSGTARFDCVGLARGRTDRLPGAMRGGLQPGCALLGADGLNAETTRCAAVCGASSSRRTGVLRVVLRRGERPRPR